MMYLGTTWLECGPCVPCPAIGLYVPGTFWTGHVNVDRRFDLFTYLLLSYQSSIQSISNISLSGQCRQRPGD